MAKKIKKAKARVQKAIKKPVKKPALKKTVKKVVAKKAPAKKPVAKKAAVKKPLRKSWRKSRLQKRLAKPATQKAPAKAVSAPLQNPVAKLPAPAPKQAAPAAAKAPAVKAAYKVGYHVVYPTHGVGKIMAEETQMIGDIELRMLVISFEKDKMTLRVPVHRATAAGLRPVSSIEQMKKVFVTLKSRARTSRGMWSRRAQEYEAKINSGNILSISEVVRDLHQNVDQSERSYSERMIYESALARLVGELAATEAVDHKSATDKLMKLLRAKVAAAAAAEVAKEAA